MSKVDKDTPIEGHDADGIREFDNDLPRWWLYGFYLTIVWSVFYLVNWHVMAEPMIGHKDQFAELQAEEKEWAPIVAKNTSRGPSASEASTDPAVLARGKEVFNGADQLCATCHREDLGGMVGPNLTDELWIHGCSVSDIMKSIVSGFQDKGMLPYGSGNKMSDKDLLAVASYILSMKGSNPVDAKPPEEGRDVPCGDDDSPTAAHDHSQHD